MTEEDNAEILHRIYYDPSHPAAFGGAGRLSKASGIALPAEEQWLQGQSSYTIHRPARKRGYLTRKCRVGGIDHLWQADLADMQAESRFNDGYKYILTVVDVFSRHGWAEPLKSKSPTHIKPAFSKIFRQGRKCIQLQTDQGTELESRTMQGFWEANRIEQYSVKSQFKAALVERFNRTLKAKMFNYFTHANTRRWLEFLPKLVEGYNKADHAGLGGMAPDEVNAENEMSLWIKQERADKQPRKAKLKVKVGDTAHQ